MFYKQTPVKITGYGLAAVARYFTVKSTDFFTVWCSGRDVDHLANSAAELRQGGKGWYAGWQGIPMNNCPWGKCKTVTVFKSGNLSE